MDYQNKNILITGASVGLGAEFAKQFHARGSNLVLVARRKELLEKMARQFNSQRNNSTQVICCDLGKTDSVEMVELLNFVKNNQIDILVNNAGFGSFGYFEELGLDRECEMLEVNIKATIKLAHQVIPQMKLRRSGAIISLSSIAGLQPIPYMSTYAATKAFNLFHSLGLHQELKDFGIHVLTVCPGPTETEFAGVTRMPGTITNSKRDRADQVVAESIRALDAKRAIIVTGLKSKFIGLISRLLPLSFSTYLVKMALKPALSRTKTL